MVMQSLPENVYKSMSGLSVEVTDTDAEGRLVLSWWAILWN
nr:hypothetical protein [Mycoplasmopsis bovis]